MATESEEEGGDHSTVSSSEELSDTSLSKVTGEGSKEVVSSESVQSVLAPEVPSRRVVGKQELEDPPPFESLLRGSHGLWFGTLLSHRRGGSRAGRRCHTGFACV